MRDQKRIKDMMQTIEIYWNMYPDLRFCQLVSNALATQHINTYDKDIFSIEDDVLDKGLEELLMNRMKNDVEAFKKGKCPFCNRDIIKIDDSTYTCACKTFNGKYIGLL